MDAGMRKTRMFVAGQPIEAWEDLDRPFGWDRAHLERYVADGEWVLLFNALVLLTAPTLAE